jgi:hypothetical protein
LCVKVLMCSSQGCVLNGTSCTYQHHLPAVRLVFKRRGSHETQGDTTISLDVD